MNTGRPRKPKRNGLVALRLRAVLDTYAIPHGRLRMALLYPNGNPLSPTAFSLMINHNTWPVTVDIDSTKRTAESFLRAQGVPDSDLVDLWTSETQPIASAAPKPPADITEALQLPEHAMFTAAARSHFRLARNPFKDDVTCADDVFLAEDQRYVRDSMYYAAKHGGFVAIIGESGSGKSTLRKDLTDRLTRDGENIIPILPKMIDKQQLSAQHICEAIIADMSTEHPKRSLEALSRQIHRILSGSMRAGNSHVLLIEEAHDLSVSTLKYLKRFYELEEGFKKLLGIILIGQPELGDRLDERRNYEAREVIRRCEVARLAPLDQKLEAYLALKFKRIGMNVDDVIDKSAYDAIRTRLTIRRANQVVESHVYPQVVQNLMVRAMNAAADLAFPKVTAELIARA